MKQQLEISYLNCDDKTRQIILDYWSMEGSEYKYGVIEVRKIHNFKVVQLINFVKNHSYVTKYNGKCDKCKNAIVIIANTREQLKNSIARTKFKICQRCLDQETIAYKQNISVLNNDDCAARIKSEEITTNPNWEKLDAYEKSVMNHILNDNNIISIGKNVFKNDYSDKHAWACLLKLQNLNLISIKRGYDNKISEVIVNHNLNHITNSVERIETTQQLPKNHLSFSLMKSISPASSRSPNYAGTFTLTSDVILEKNRKYLYGGWIQTDGSINLKFTPTDQVMPTKQNDLSSEPKSLATILKNMSYELE